MKKIKDSKGKTFAHLVGRGTIEIKRSNQTFIVTGKDFSILGTSAFAPDAKELVVVENGVLVEDGVKLVEETQTDDKKDEKQDGNKSNDDKNTETEADALKEKHDKSDEEER